MGVGESHFANCPPGVTILHQGMQISFQPRHRWEAEGLTEESSPAASNSPASKAEPVSGCPVPGRSTSCGGGDSGPRSVRLEDV